MNFSQFTISWSYAVFDNVINLITLKKIQNKFWEFKDLELISYFKNVSYALDDLAH